jgi:hypothetical protein
MPDEQRSTPGMVPGLVQEIINQMRASTEKLQDLVRSRVPLTPGSYPLPGALSAAQVKSLTDSIASQRRSIEALKAQLSAFDEQLTTLEQLLGPLAEWSRAWADVEARLLNLGRNPESGR